MKMLDMNPKQLDIYQAMADRWAEKAERKRLMKKKKLVYRHS